MGRCAEFQSTEYYCAPIPLGTRMSDLGVCVCHCQCPNSRTSCCTVADRPRRGPASPCFFFLFPSFFFAPLLSFRQAGYTTN